MQAKISYQTITLPPPYAYAFTLEVKIGQNGTEVNLDLEYLNRDELTEDDITGEGFDLADRYTWQGTLPKVWSAVLRDWLQKEKLREPAEEEEAIWIHLDLGSKQGLVTQTDLWEYRLQELLQAIYEQAGKEQPLLVKLIDRERGANAFYEIKGFFARRSGQVNGRAISWEQLQAVMSHLFQLDFDEMGTDQPNSDGLWIDPNGISGYQSVEKLVSGKSKAFKKQLLELLKPRA